MLIKMRESKGFTLVELMIVVAIIGILAAVAVPFYQRYVQKARLTSLVFPTMHSVQTNAGAVFSTRQAFPQTVADLVADSSTRYVTLATPTGDYSALTFTVNSSTGPLVQLHGKTIIATAVTQAGKVIKWDLSGSLANQLGLK